MLPDRCYKRDSGRGTVVFVTAVFVTAVFVAVVVILPGGLLAGDSLAAEDDLVKAAAARKILEAWHQNQPETEPRFLHLVCWTPSDRALPADYQRRLTRIMEHIRDFYARGMQMYGLGKRSIRLKYNDRQELILHAVRGRHVTSHYGMQSGQEIRRECLPVLEQAGIAAGRETILIFCNLATWDETQRRFRHKSPYYAGGSFRAGTAWQLDSPELDSRHLKLPGPMIQDGQYGRISLGRHNSIFIGGIAHELGHALGLPHCRARPDEAVRGTALMGSGNRTYGEELRGAGRGSVLTLAHALRLASHPQFSGSIKGLASTATASIEELSIVADDRAIRVSGVVTGTPPVYAVVAYFDPAGGSDYDATTATAVPAGDGRFMLHCDALVPGKTGQLRLFPLHANGSAGGQMSRTRFQFPYRIARDGSPDLSTLQVRMELAPVLKALAQGNRRQASELAGRVKSEQAAMIAENLTQEFSPTQSPDEFQGKLTSVSLTRFRPKSARVGWLRPAYNRLPDAALLLESGGQIFETGIYAHAPASHAYVLGGKWQSLSGQAGLAAGHAGSVQFEIRGDGKTLWKSPVLRAGRTVNFDVNVKNVQQLELLTDPTGDGPGSDWALWLKPLLKRAT